MKQRPLFLLLLVLGFSSAVAQQSIIDSLQKIVSLQKHDSIEISALLGLSYEFLRSDLIKTKSYAFQALALSNQINKDFGKSAAYQYLLTIYQTSGKLDSA